MGRFRWRGALWLSLGTLLAVLACGAGLWLTPLGLLPQAGLAQARWRAQGIRHYRMTVRFSQGWILSGPWTVEVRDEQVIGGNDMGTGAPLNPVQMRVAQRTLPISTIFAAIDRELRQPAINSPRDLATLLARMLPPDQRDRLNHCAARMPEISYDPTLGYPSGVTVYASPCFPGGDWTVLVMALTPLP
jgi:hypothetical protein